jgi:hypothetical protein
LTPYSRCRIVLAKPRARGAVDRGIAAERLVPIPPEARFRAAREPVETIAGEDGVQPFRKELTWR